MKKIITIFLILLVTITFTSCAKNEEKPKDDYIINDRIYATEIELGYYPQVKVTDELILQELIKQTVNEENKVEYLDKTYLVINNEYYEYLPIVWDLIDVNGNKYYISRYILDQQEFLNVEYVMVVGSLSYSKKPGIPKGIFANNYEYSDLREWLNNEFYNTIFTDEEKAKLQKISYDGLEDYVYTLATSEITNLNNPATNPTDYATTIGCDVCTVEDNYPGFDGMGVSWLRTPNDVHLYRVHALNYDGIVYEYVDCHYEGVGVRPVIALK